MSGKDGKDFIMDAERLYEKIEETNKTVNQILIELNNGLKSEVKRNTKSIDKLTEHINKVTNRINTIEGENKEQQGKLEGRSQIGQAIREWGGWIATIIILILRIIGVI